MEHFVRTTRWLNSAGVTLQIGVNCRIRQWSGRDAETFREAVRARNVFSRHAGPRDFYFQRATELLDQTVIEVYGGGESPSTMLGSHAELAEGIALASFVLHGSRREFFRRLVGTSEKYLDLYLVRSGPKPRVTSNSARVKPATGLQLDARSVSRYQKLGFQGLYELAIGTTELSGRIRSAVRWLVQSRTDPSVESALVKTSTALESLLVVGREPPTRALQERSAYLLTEDPTIRARVAKASSRFYDFRGSIVHGKKEAKQSDIESALEFGDRLVVLSALVLARQAGAWKWKSAADLQVFCDGARWGRSQPCLRPWPRSHLRNLLAQFEGGA